MPLLTLDCGYTFGRRSDGDSGMVVEASREGDGVLGLIRWRDGSTSEAWLVHREDGVGGRYTDEGLDAAARALVGAQVVVDEVVAKVR